MNSQQLRKRDEEIARLRTEEGLTLKEIGERLNLSKERVRQVLIRAGVPRGVKGRVPRRRRRRGPVPRDMWKYKQEIIHLYVDKRLSLKEIGERFGHSHVAVIYLLEAAGVRRRTPNWGSHWPWRDWKQRTKEIIGAYVEDELSLEEVGARFGLSPTCVRDILIKAGVGCRSPGWPAWRSKALARRNQEIIRLCLEEGLKRKEVAARFHLRPETVSRILARASMHRGQPEAK